MANNWLIEQTIDLQHGVQAPLVWPNALMLCGDNNAHTWRVMIMDGGESAQITGNITGYFVRTDGNTVTVTGGLSGNVATVTLPQACYATDGDLYAVMRLKSSSGTITLSALILPVRNVLTDSIIDPGEVIPSLDDLLAQIDACEEATDAANDAADAANQAAQSASAVESDIEITEAARVTAEQGRVAAEQARASAEAARVANENERQQQLTNAINAAEADANRAEAAADAAETLIAMPPLFSDAPPTDTPTLNKLWIDTGVSPTMMRRWRGADVTTEREYTETRVGCGKNLLKPQGDATVGGVTYTLQSDGTYLANGTVTSTNTLSLYKGVLPAGQYTISGGAGGIQVSLAVYKADGTYIRTICASNRGATQTGTVTGLTGEEAYHQAFVQAVSTIVGQTVTNVVLSPQLEAGSTATAFEPYQDIPYLALDNAQGQIESVAVEAGCRAKQEVRKNIFPSLTSAVTTRGLTASPQADGTVVISGTATGQLTAYTYTGTLPDGQYTISGGADNASVSLIAVDANNQWKRTIAASWGGAQTFTLSGLLDGEDHIRMMIQTANDSAGQTFDNVVLSPQLETGGTATAFEPYKSILPITGRESMEIAACGKNLFPSLASAITGGGLTASPQADGTVVISGTATGQLTTYTYTGTLPDGQYTISGGADNASVSLIAVDANNQWKRTIGLSWGNPGTFNFNGLLDGEYCVRMMIQTANDSAGQTFDNVVLSPQLETGGTATAFEPYRSMGGGTVTPTEPLYGLLGAEDTVEASVDGDVLVTRRTAVLELDGTETNIVVVEPSSNHARLQITPAKAARPAETTRTLGKALCSHYKTVSTGAQWNDAAEGVGVETNGTILIFDARFTTLEAWKAYLAAQKTAGTPVTIVYELATPTTETPADVDPIEPQAGQLNISTDADALSATVHGSGWDTISDQTGLLATIAQLTARVAALEQAAVNSIGG